MFFFEKKDKIVQNEPNMTIDNQRVHQNVFDLSHNSAFWLAAKRNFKDSSVSFSSWTNVRGDNLSC